jgi:hypothetical protein
MASARDRLSALMRLSHSDRHASADGVDQKGASRWFDNRQEDRRALLGRVPAD